MWKLESGKGVAAIALAASLSLTACGGGSSGGGGGNAGDGGNNPGGGGDTTTQYQGVEGPLDVVQEPLSTQVFGTLADGAAGTPLEGAVKCLDQVVVEDVVDVLDSVLAVASAETAADPQAAFGTAQANLQLAAGELLNDLPNLLASLAGQSDCSGTSTGGGDNPLAGTPLAPLADALAPFLGGNFDPSNMDLTTLSGLFASLSSAFSDGIDGLPPEVAGAPVLGGLLATLDVALADLAVTTNAVALTDGAAVSAGVTTTLDHLLTGVLVDVVPIGFFEEQAGQPGLFSAQIESAVGEITGQLDGALATALVPLFDGLETLLTSIEGALSGGLPGGVGAGPTGTPLDALLGPLTSLTDSLPGAGGVPSGDGVTGTPLDILLAPLVSAIEGGGAGACPLASTPLNPLCSVVDGLLGGLSASPGANPLSILTDLVDTLLGGLLGGVGGQA